VVGADLGPLSWKTGRKRKKRNDNHLQLL